jgi:hypothetical protein
MSLLDSDGDGVCDLLDCEDPNDIDADGIPDPCDNCVAEANPDQLDSDGDDQGGDACDPCPLDWHNRCDLNQTEAGLMDPNGGTLTTPDGKVSLDIPAGALSSPTTVSMTEGAREFKVGASRKILETSCGPDGKTFGLPVTITFAWDDADDDGKVDGFDSPEVTESELSIWRDGRKIAGPCSDPAFRSPSCTTACCDVAANTWTLEVSSFSEFVLGQESFMTLSGKSMMVRDKASDPTRRKMVVVSRDAAIETPEAESANDPRTAGAVIQLFNPSTGQTDEFILPPGSEFWKPLGTSPEGKNGWKYLDRTFMNGCCRSLLVKPGDPERVDRNGAPSPKPGTLRAVCVAKEKPIAFALDAPNQGNLAVTVQLGAEPPYCVPFGQNFGGTVLRDFGTGVKRTGVGLFKVRESDAPDACPIP